MSEIVSDGSGRQALNDALNHLDYLNKKRLMKSPAKTTSQTSQLPPSVVKALEEWNNLHQSFDLARYPQRIKVFTVDSPDMLEHRFEEWVVNMHIEGYSVVVNTVNLTGGGINTVMVVLYQQFPNQATVTAVKMASKKKKGK